jgi:TRAP-type C4-dicarboxylate transport system substrate-binding protein
VAESKGLVGIGIRVAADSLYFGAKNPPKTLADFKGTKLRVNATPAERARMAALGATAVPTGLQEIVTSLQNGVVDGTMNGISIYTNFNLQNVGKTLLETDDTLLIAFVCLSKAWLDTLPPDLDKTIVDEARKLRPWAEQTAVDEGIELRAKWKAAGRRPSRTEQEAEADRRGHHQGQSVLKAFYDKIQTTAAKY